MFWKKRATPAQIDAALTGLARGEPGAVIASVATLLPRDVSITTIDDSGPLVVATARRDLQRLSVFKAPTADAAILGAMIEVLHGRVRRH
jgi:acyl-coenzyme A synthetase/AMP-(fatty) acid ligase